MRSRRGPKTLFNIDDKTFGIPVDLAPVSMIVNLTAYKELGIDPATTLDEAYEQCATARAAGKSLYAIAGAGPPNLGLFASQIAASLVYGEDPDWNTKRANKEVTFADSAGMEGDPAAGHRLQGQGLLPGRCRGCRLPRTDQRHHLRLLAEHLRPIRRGRGLQGCRAVPGIRCRRAAGRYRRRYPVDPVHHQRSGASMPRARTRKLR